MLSSVLRSQRAVQVNIAIMRAFVKLREMLAAHKRPCKEADAMEKKYDSQFKVVFDAIRQLMVSPAEKMKVIKGFREGEIAIAEPITSAILSDTAPPNY